MITENGPHSHPSEGEKSEKNKKIFIQAGIRTYEKYNSKK
jgi:hypothetical protein